MLKVSTEYRKGILFIRLVGMIDNEGYLDQINCFLNKIGIQYVVFNLDKLNDVSLESVNHIIDYNKQLLKKKKLLIICDANQKRNRLFKNIIPKISSELEAFSLI